MATQTNKPTNQQTTKQANKQPRKKSNRKRLCNKQTCICSSLETIKDLSKILFNIDIMNLYLSLCFDILFKRQREIVAMMLMCEVVLASKNKISEPIDA